MTATARGAVRVVLATAASRAQAASIAKRLVEERLAACVNILGPARSIYRWRGKVEDEREFLMFIKTRAALFSRVERRIRELHSYEIPEVIVLKPAAVSKPYMRWLLASTGSKRA